MLKTLTLEKAEKGDKQSISVRLSTITTTRLLENNMQGTRNDQTITLNSADTVAHQRLPQEQGCIEREFAEPPASHENNVTIRALIRF